MGQERWKEGENERERLTVWERDSLMASEVYLSFSLQLLFSPFSMFLVYGREMPGREGESEDVKLYREGAVRWPVSYI